MASDKSQAKDEAQLLPILRHETQILDAVASNDAVVVIGETGSGKTTQLSQILHRAGYTKSGMVGITQPRRVAAVSVARRVAFEMGVQVGEEVGYSIRFEDRTSSKTCIKYLTDGCLLRECLDDSELSAYSVIILDEAHERSLNTDILLGVLKHLVGKKTPGFKVVVTSATLDGDKISKFFFNCPVITVPGKLFPVEILYSTVRPTNYVESAIETAMDIHVHQPPGDILMFMTGQEEIKKALKNLEDRVRRLEEDSCLDLMIFPLYASLPPEMQARVFAPPQEGCRRIIVATNIAETSLTVDGVVYVIDPGYVKQRQYNPSTGMDSLTVLPISRVQAAQRAGRAGRTRPGKCYRLYPESTYNHEMLAVTVPEIQRSSLGGAVLHLKSLELPNLDILRFDFLDQPSGESLENALRQLYAVDAIDEDGKITGVGRRMAELPLEPSLARALIEAESLGCLDQALTVASMLSCDSLFLEHSRKDGDRKRDREFLPLPDGKGMGDHVQLLQIFESWESTDYDSEWCSKHGLQLKAMRFARNVRQQLAGIMQKGDGRYTEDRSRQGAGSVRTLRKALCRGYANQLASRMPHHNGYRTIGHKSQLVQIHPSTSSLKVDDDGLLPEWVLYQELVATPRAYIRHVCVVEGSWVKPALTKLESTDVQRLSGRVGGSEDLQGSRAEEVATDKKPEAAEQSTKADLSVSAARERYLARKTSRLLKEQTLHPHVRR